MLNINKNLNLVKFVLKNPKKFKTAVTVILDPKEFKRRIRINFDKSNFQDTLNLKYTKYFKKNYPTKKLLAQQRKLAKNFKIKPKISIITPTFNTPIRFLTECIESVLNQSYQNFELCLADDGSKQSKIKNLIKSYKDKRIKYVFLEKNLHISGASNEALKLATGEWVGLLDHDDILWPNALFEVVKSINENPKAEFIYTDEDKLSNDSKTHFSPSFKPDFNPDYLRSANYIVHFSLIKKTLFDKVGGFRSKYDGAQDWDLFLRVTRLTNQIIHIPKVLYSWRVSKKSTASSEKAMEVKGYAFANQKGVLEDDLKTRDIKGQILQTKLLGIWRVKYEIVGKPLVSIIIPTKDQYQYIARCLNSILKKTSWKNLEIIIVDTGSTDKKVFKLYSKLKSKVKVINWEKEFNFSEVCNYGAQKSSGDYLLFLNNDTEVKTANWIENMLEHAQRKEVGAVGAKLLFPDGTIQHAGVILGLKNILGEEVVAGHAFRGVMDHSPNTHLIDSIRDYCAVTAACLMVSRNNFEKVKGFDPIFRVAFNDVDFCLKLLKLGLNNIYTPYSVLTHFESVSVGQLGSGKRDLTEYRKEINLMLKKWPELINNDPSYNINLSRTSEDFSLR